MHKRRVLLLICCIIGVLLLSATVFFLITKGTVEEKDGLLQNSRVYMEDIRYEDEKIYYTIVNGTCRHQFAADKPYVQKKVDGKWTFISVYEDRSMISVRLDAFESREYYFTVTAPANMTAGEYRLLFGEIRLGSNGVWQGYSDTPYIVGYFTIPAPTE